MQKVRGWLTKRPISSAALALIIGAIIGCLIGVAVSASETDELKRARAELENRLHSAKQNVSEAAGAPSKLEEERVETVRQRSQLAEKEKELERGGEHSSRQERANKAAAELETINDGMWKSGTDFVPGTYRARGGPHCYWATLNSANSEDVASNGFGEANPAVSIESPWFQAEDCGQWERIE